MYLHLHLFDLRDYQYLDNSLAIYRILILNKLNEIYLCLKCRSDLNFKDSSVESSLEVF